MLTDFFIKAPAKINIGLRVFPKRADGFHEIEGIFQSINLYDELKVSILNNNGSCSIKCIGMNLPTENTLQSTYDAFCRLTGLKPGIRILLKKGIPSGGGLGGASTDAASFLQALEKLTEKELTFSEEEKIAGEVGSDVFFFLHCRGAINECAIVTGRGEFVRKIKARDDLHYVMIFPGIYCSTKECYSLVDGYFVTEKMFPYPDPDILETVYNSPLKDWDFRNSFTPVVVKEYPVIGQALSDLKKAGAVFAEMSGSGSTVYGVFESEELAEKAFGIIAQNWKSCMLL